MGNERENTVISKTLSLAKSKLKCQVETLNLTTSIWNISSLGYHWNQRIVLYKMI